jgi:hypothetical protein
MIRRLVESQAPVELKKNRNAELNEQDPPCADSSATPRNETPRCCFGLFAAVERQTIFGCLIDASVPSSSTGANPVGECFQCSPCSCFEAGLVLRFWWPTWILSKWIKCEMSSKQSGLPCRKASPTWRVWPWPKLWSTSMSCLGLLASNDLVKLGSKNPAKDGVRRQWFP